MGAHASTLRDWMGVPVCKPAAIVRPETLDELVDAVVERRGGSVRAIGSAHSTSAVTATDGTLVLTDDLKRVLSVDVGTLRVTVEAGVKLHELVRLLAVYGLALPNTGGVLEQSIAGACGTATHGTGVGFGTLSTVLATLYVVTADGSLVRLDRDDPNTRDGFLAMSANLGAGGVVYAVTLQCVPAFNLVRELTRSTALRELQDWEAKAAAHPHWQITMNPFTDMCVVQAYTVELSSITAARRVAMGFFGFVRTTLGVLASLGGAAAALVALVTRLGVASALVDTSFSLAVGATHGASFAITASPFTPPFDETEIAVDSTRTLAAHAAARRVATRLRAERGARVPMLLVSFRFVGGGSEEPFMSPARGRRIATYVSVIIGGVGRDDADAVARMFDDEFAELDGRAHWGKLAACGDVDRIRALWGAESVVRYRRAIDALDPRGVFLSPWTERAFYT